MSEPARQRMPSDDIIAWAAKQCIRHELAAGKIVGRTPERAAPARGEDGIILTRIVREGPILLESPGITLTDCFPPGVA